MYRLDRSVSYAVPTCLLLLVLLVARCDSGPNEPPDNKGNQQPSVVSKDIGPQGGTITSGDDRLTLTIPEGALTGTETITIEEITTDDLGAEFDAIVDVLGVGNAYELKPDGLDFQQPVTARVASDQTPAQGGDSLGVIAEFLFTSDGETVEALDSLRLEPASDDSGTLHVSGLLTHFSTFTHTSANKAEAQGLINFSVNGIPDALDADDEFTVTALVNLIALQAEEASYADGSLSPIKPTALPQVEPQDLPRIGASEFGGTVSYGCEQPGDGGIYKAEVSIVLAEDGQPSGLEALAGEEYTAGFTKFDIECQGEVTLTVATEGDGEGTVTSEPAGINCPSDGSGDCDEPYPPGTNVTLTAEAELGSEFVEWSGDGTTSDDGTRTVTMDAAKDVTATFRRLSLEDVLQEGLYKLVDYGLVAPEFAHVLASSFSNRNDLRTVPHGKFAQQNQQGEASFGQLTGSLITAFSGAEGLTVIDLLTREELLNVTGPDVTGSPAFGVIGLSEPPPGNAATLVLFGQTGFGLYDTQGGGHINAANQPPAFDAFPAGGNPFSSYAVVVGTDGVNFIYYDEELGLHRFTFFSESGIPAHHFDGEVISAWMPDDGTPDDTPLLVLDRAVESGLYLALRDGLAPTRIADVGLDARKIRCVDSGGDLICGITVFGSDEVKIVIWDGQNAPTVVGTVPVGDGPVDLNLTLLENSNVGLVTTGFNDNTLTEIEVAPNGSVVNSDTRPVLDGCQSPGHAIFGRDAESMKVIGTCYDSSNYFIVESAL